VDCGFEKMNAPTMGTLRHLTVAFINRLFMLTDFWLAQAHNQPYLGEWKT
jgi:hypothetical protein